MRSVLAFMLLFSAPLFAEQNNCDSQNIAGPYVYNLMKTGSNGCLLQITPLNKPDLLYREYVLDEGGRLLIFNSTPGDYETSTSRRVFFLFPRIQTPSLKVEQEQVIVQISSGAKLHFSTTTEGVQKIDGFQFTEDTRVALNTKGGFEITSYPGIYLDTGYMVGADSYRYPDNSSNFIDRSGIRCTVGNREIFDYQSSLYGEPILGYQSDEKLKEFLATRCPQLSWEVEI